MVSQETSQKCKELSMANNLTYESKKLGVMYFTVAATLLGA